jgi:hypothetical protein
MSKEHRKEEGPGMVSDLITEELWTLGGMLSSGGMTVGAAVGLYRDYGTAIEILDIAADLHHTARHREEAEAGEPEPHAEAEL